MGGSGSGRSASRYVGTVEGVPGLELRTLKRAGALVPGAVTTCSWRGGEVSIGMRCEPHLLVLNYSVNGQPRREEVPLERTPCRFGGRRPWFNCPHCRRRVGRLHLSSWRFICRRCARLTYRTHRASLSDRGWAKIHKAYRALGLDPSEAELLPNVPKPKGMHWATFNRHLEAMERGAEMRDTLLFSPSVMRFLTRHGGRK